MILAVTASLAVKENTASAIEENSQPQHVFLLRFLGKMKLWIVFIEWVKNINNYDFFVFLFLNGLFVEYFGYLLLFELSLSLFGILFIYLFIIWVIKDYVLGAKIIFV